MDGLSRTVKEVFAMTTIVQDKLSRLFLAVLLLTIVLVGCKQQHSTRHVSYFESLSLWRTYPDERTPMPSDSSCEEAQKRAKEAIRLFLERRWDSLQSYFDTVCVPSKTSKNSFKLMIHYRDRGKSVKDLGSADSIHLECVSEAI